MTDQDSTFGMYKHFLTLTFVLLLEIHLMFILHQEKEYVMDIVTQSLVNSTSS